MTTAEGTCMISASKSTISCHFLMISEGTGGRAGMVSSSLIFQQVETPFARPAAAHLWNVSDDERQSGAEVREFPSPRPSASLQIGSSPRCPQDWKMLSRISAEPEGQIPLTHTGTLSHYTPKFQRRFRASATVVNLTAGWQAHSGTLLRAHKPCIDVRFWGTAQLDVRPAGYGDWFRTAFSLFSPLFLRSWQPLQKAATTLFLQAVAVATNGDHVGAGCGQRRMNLAAHISVHLARRARGSMSLLQAFISRESCVKTPFQMLFINRLAKVADDPIVQGADPVNIIGVGSHEDCRNRTPCIDEVSIEFDSGHRRHVYVGD
jgi:hypothetical protein